MKQFYKRLVVLRTFAGIILALALPALAEAPVTEGTGPGSESAVPAKPKESVTIYSPIGKRDPFRTPAPAQPGGRELAAINPLEKFSVDQMQLRAILRSTALAKAMIEDPEGKTYIISEGDVVGRERGTVSKIQNTQVIVTFRTFNYLGVESLFEKVLFLPQTEDNQSRME